MAELSVPQLNFASLGDLPQVYKQAQNQANSELTLAALGRGEITREQAASRLMSSDPQRAMTLATLGNNERDFQFRQQEAARAQTNADRAFALQQRQFEDKPQVTFNPEAGVYVEYDPRTRQSRVIPTQGATPPGGQPGQPGAAPLVDLSKKNKFSATEIDRLTEEGTKLQNSKRYADTFKDSYGGYGTQMFADIAQSYANKVPSSMSSPEQRDGANWWRDYRAYENDVRHGTFGASLTPNEQKAFSAASITPDMQPDQIKVNLARQRDIMHGAAERRMNAYRAAKYDTAPIEAAFGFAQKAPQTQQAQPQGQKQAAPVRISSPQDRAALDPGTSYIAPDGSVRTKQ